MKKIILLNSQQQCNVGRKSKVQPLPYDGELSGLKGVLEVSYLPLSVTDARHGIAWGLWHGYTFYAHFNDHCCSYFNAYSHVLLLLYLLIFLLRIKMF